VVLGGGPIGCELAQAFARLGSQVTQVEMLPRILPREDPEFSEMVAAQMRADGVNLLTGHKAARFLPEKILVCENGVRVEFDALLCAVGRVARTKGFGLETLGIGVSKARTVETNEFLQTVYPNIYACGDVAGPYQFTHVGAHQAWYASVNALFGFARKFRADYSVIPWATFTEPEVARVGLNELEARERGVPYEVTVYGLDDLDRAIADGSAQGRVKVLSAPGSDRVLGATIAGEHAGDLIAEFVVAMRHGLGLNKILGTIHIYPTLAEANKYAAGAWKKGARAAARARRPGKAARLETRMRWLAAALVLFSACANAFEHARWDALLKRHVVLLEGGKASQLDYAGVAAEREALRDYLSSVSAVKEAEFNAWPKREQMAFLINAYNAFTVEKILTRYPDIRSIWDFGKVFGNPFRDEFFSLLGARMSLDGIEHGILRKRYGEPRVHYALNCASVGCPMLREQAYVGAHLEKQLEEQARRFLSDRSRNRYREGRLEVSKIFDWFKEDFEPREEYFERYAQVLGVPVGARPRLAFLDYDWSLNDSRSSSRR
jgi:hypothetical protein